MVVAGAPLALLLLFALWLLGPGRHRGVHGPFTVAESSQEQQLQPPPDRGAAGSQQAGTAPPTSDAPPAPEGPSASAVRRPGDPDNRTPILVELSKPERSQPLSALPPAPAVPPQAPPEPAPRPPARSAAAADQPSRPRQSPPPTLAAPPAEATPQAAAGGAGGTAEEMDAAAAPDVGASSGPGAAAGAASDEDESEPAPRPAEPGTAPLPRPASPGATPFLRPAEPGPGSYSPPARPRTEALPVPHRRAPAADTGADLNGSWELHNTIDSTRSSAYRGLRLTYSIDLRQEGSRIVGDGEKTAENGRTVPASQRTQIHVSGELVGRELRLVFTERGLWRGSGGNFRWRLSADGASLAGTFASNVADSRGSSEASRVP